MLDTKNKISTQIVKSHPREHISSQKFFISLFSILFSFFFLFSVFSFFPSSQAYAATDKSDALSRLEKAKSDYNNASNNIERLEGEIKNNESEISFLEDSISVETDDLCGIARSIYKNGGDAPNIAVLLFSSDKLMDAVRTYGYLQDVYDYQQGVLSSLISNKQILSAKREELAEEKEQADKEFEKCEQARKEAQAEYDKVIEEEKRAQAASQNSGGASGGSNSSSVKRSGWSGSWNSGYMNLSTFKRRGVVNDNGFRYTYYSETVLPGGGLNIPGRHVDSRGCVCNGDGLIIVANVDFPKGTVVPTPLGDGIVWDTGCAHGTIDIYVH